MSTSASCITIASGLPRSGTSLMMQMLAAGGLPPLTDAVRAADESNPRGYFEYEPVKQLRAGSSWLADAQGRAVKIIHLLLRELPVDGRFEYRVLLMNRPIEEVLASQRAMLQHQGKTAAPDAVLRSAFQAQLQQVERWLAEQSCFSVLPVDYHRLLRHADQVAQEVSAFLELDLDTAAMAAAVDPSLYRQRMSGDV